MKIKLLLPTTMVAVAAPIATTVACGNSKKLTSTKNGSSTSNPTHDAIEGVPPLSDYFKSAFTPQTLKERAIQEKDDTFWNGGLAYHAFAQTVSILKGLAHEYGYDTKDATTNLSPKEAFLNATGGKIISDSPTDLKIDPSDSEDIKILKSVKSTGFTSTKVPAGFSGDQSDLRLILPDFFGKGGFSKWHANNDYTAALKYDGDPALLEDKNTGNDADGNPMMKAIEDLYFKSFAVYNDPEVPGQLIAQIEDSNDSGELKALREIKLPHMSQVYPIIDNDSAFVNEIVPAVQDAFSKVIQILGNQTIESILEGMAEVHVKVLFDEINFLKNIFFKTTTNDDGTVTYVAKPELSSKNFVEKLQKLNNGSAHWLALEALEKGFDYEFTSNGKGDSTPNEIYEWVSEGNPSMINNVKAGEDMIGFSTNIDASDSYATALTLLPWTSFAQYIFRSNIYASHPIASVGKSANLAATPSYGFDKNGLQKSFDKITTGL